MSKLIDLYCQEILKQKNFRVLLFADKQPALPEKLKVKNFSLNFDIEILFWHKLPVGSK